MTEQPETEQLGDEDEDEIRSYYYYDSHPTEDDLRGEPTWHSELVRYLVQVLTWQFRGQKCIVHKNLNFYHTSDPNEYPMDPDIAVIKGATFQYIRSWKIGETGPAPQVIFEIGQEETWKRDLEEGPLRCARMGVEEYYVYDPEDPPLGGDAGRRLFGWQLDKTSGEMREMPVGQDGRLWSEHLDSFLVPDGQYLRLYERQSRLCLTEAEAQTRRADAEAEARHAAERRADLEAEARRAAERLTEAVIKRAEVLAEKLRSLGIDPASL